MFEDGSITWAPCWVHARRKFFELSTGDRSVQEHAKVSREAAALVKRINDILLAERGINGVCWIIGYILKRWPAFAHFLEDGRICLTNNTAERALRGVALERKAWLFAGFACGGQRAAIIYSLIQTAKMNKVDAQVWLADVLARIAGRPNSRLADLLPWNWQASGRNSAFCGGQGPPSRASFPNLRLSGNTCR